jgi:hypothetical protein
MHCEVSHTACKHAFRNLMCTLQCCWDMGFQRQTLAQSTRPSRPGSASTGESGAAFILTITQEGDAVEFDHDLMHLAVLSSTPRALSGRASVRRGRLLARRVQHPGVSAAYMKGAHVIAGRILLCLTGRRGYCPHKHQHENGYVSTERCTARYSAKLTRSEPLARSDRLPFAKIRAPCPHEHASTAHRVENIEASNCLSRRIRRRSGQASAPPSTTKPPPGHPHPTPAQAHRSRPGDGWRRTAGTVSAASAMAAASPPAAATSPAATWMAARAARMTPSLGSESLAATAPAPAGARIRSGARAPRGGRRIRAIRVSTARRAPRPAPARARCQGPGLAPLLRTQTTRTRMGLLGGNGLSTGPRRPCPAVRVGCHDIPLRVSCRRLHRYSPVAASAAGYDAARYVRPQGRAL